MPEALMKLDWIIGHRKVEPGATAPPYLAWGGGFGLSAGVPWGVDFLLLLRLALGGGFRLSAGLPGGFAFAN